MREKELRITSVTPAENYVNFIETGNGILFVAELDNRNGYIALKEETYSLAKWLKQNRPSIKIEVESCDKFLSLNSDEYWIPLIFLANDVALSLFTSALYDYLKNKVKGALSKEPNKVHLQIVRKKGKSYHEINYDGPIEGLQMLREIDNE